MGKRKKKYSDANGISQIIPTVASALRVEKIVILLPFHIS